MTKPAPVQPCRLHGTQTCDRLARGDCKICPGGGAGEERIDGLEEHLKAVEALLPEGGPEELFLSETCLLCAGEPKKRRVYALWDFGNVQPVKENPSLLGVRRQAKVGAIVPLQFACCETCKKNWQTMSLALPVSVAAGGMIGLLTGFVLPVRNALAKAHPALPLGVFVACVLLGWLAGTALRNGIRRKKSGETVLDVAKLPYVAKMQQKGWFPLFGGKFKPPVFSTTRRKRGWFC